MPVENRPEPYPLGTMVKILNSGYRRARIVEIRGNLGPQGARIYRLMYRRKPTPSYIEVREDQLELLAAPESPADSSSPLPDAASPPIAEQVP